MSQQIKIYDIAGAAGVSLATVSRVLNHPEKVKEATRNKVLRIIKEKGYKPNANARGLASRKSTTVAIVIPKISRASVAEMIQGIDDSAKKFGYTLRLFIAEAGLNKDFWGEVVASSVDGILLMNDEVTQEVVSGLKSTPVPVVFINQLPSSDEFGSVGLDYENAAYQVTKLMIERGNKDIMFISTEHKYTVNDMKERGYRRAMQEAGLPENIIYTSGDININEKDFKEILAKGAPDVAIAVRDSIAISFMNVAQNMGYKVPDQVQVIGFQNTRYAVLSNPKLTCVDTPVYEIGAKAMAYLTELMTGRANKANSNVLIDYQIVWRESTRNE